MEKEINNNAVSELDEASLEQVTGGIQNSNVLVAPGQAVGGGDVAGPNILFRTGGLDEINKAPVKAYLDGTIFVPGD